MEDRDALYPGRVRLTPVPGTTDLFDMEMADQPRDNGTALNKANLLSDATAAAINAAFGSTPDTINEALALLAGGSKYEAQSYVGAGTYGVGNETVISFTHEPKLVIVMCAVVSSSSYQYANYKDTVVLPWQALKDIQANGSTYAYINTVPYVYSDNLRWYYAKFVLSNDNKTLSLWDTASAERQWNASNLTYNVISFY